MTDGEMIQVVDRAEKVLASPVCALVPKAIKGVMVDLLAVVRALVEKQGESDASG